MDIVCRKYSCTYNKDMKCERKHLSVDKKAKCSDIAIDKNKEKEDVSKEMFGHEPEVAPFRHCKCIDIKCNSTSCLFNKNHNCVSNGILVGSAQACAPCNSYQEK
ncbi:MAG: DUF1540 domain-containing protein [Clostridia bacterium]|nr:DUF1540 domain-containing protein [Clostridia bacterium]